MIDQQLISENKYTVRLQKITKILIFSCKNKR